MLAAAKGYSPEKIGTWVTVTSGRVATTVPNITSVIGARAAKRAMTESMQRSERLGRPFPAQLIGKDVNHDIDFRNLDGRECVMCAEVVHNFPEHNCATVLNTPHHGLGLP